jgi:putative transposase
MRFLIKRSEMFCVVTLCRRHRGASARPLGPAFIRTHLALLAGTDFFTVEVLTLRGLATYYVLFFIHLESRRVDVAGITIHPDEPWMKQIARHVTIEGYGILRDFPSCRSILNAQQA